MPHLCKSACKAKFVLKRAHARRARPHAHVGPGRMCRTLVLTDHNAQVVERLAANVALNRASNLAACEAVSVECLDWRDFLAPGPRREGGLGLTERDLLGITGGPGPGGGRVRPGVGRPFVLIKNKHFDTHASKPSPGVNFEAPAAGASKIDRVPQACGT